MPKHFSVGDRESLANLDPGARQRVLDKHRAMEAVQSGEILEHHADAFQQAEQGQIAAQQVQFEQQRIQAALVSGTP